MRPLLLALALAACKDVSSYATGNDHYEGSVVPAGFVRTGIDDDVRMCLTLDTNHLQESPGVITSSDSRFSATPLRPIPQVWHDSLSTLSFGEGRSQNLLYAASEPAGDDMVIVSLLNGGGVEVRLLRGAPGAPPSDAGTPTPSLFAVFELSRAPGPCPL
jgi:hypothetical protein